MAPPSNRARGPRRGGRGRKPSVHKRRGGVGVGSGGGGGGSKHYAAAGNRGDVAVNVGADWKKRRRNRPGGRASAAGNKVSSSNNNASSRRRRSNNNARWNNNNNKVVRRPDEVPSTGGTGGGGLQPIKVKSSGIMSTWKKPLGGLIRYYVHTRMNDKRSPPVDQKTAEEEIDKFYYRSGCDMEETKTAILESLGVTKDIQKGWINISMAIEKEGTMDGIPISSGKAMDTSNNEDDNNNASPPSFDETVDGKGIKLHQILRNGEGPAHSQEQWTTIVVPTWAENKSFFFEVKNYSPLNLSCELFLDGEKVAFNAPLLPKSTRTIRPDAVRYYARHQWILNSARRVKFSTASNGVPSSNGNAQGVTRQQPTTPRYNGIRPNYEGQRVSNEQYPDPTIFGWEFTGSVQASRVEFFTKRMNIGLVKLDFYYTTGTIKTVLHHPTSGTNQLFRAQVTPEQYVQVMKNPRAHTGQGYRRAEDRPTGSQNNETAKEEDDEFDRMPTETTEASEKDSEMEDTDATGTYSAQPNYYAKNDTYDFKRQGHLNRFDQMNKLEQSRDYAEWREANKKEYAVVHAKFYVSIPKRMAYRAPPKGGRGFRQQRGKNNNMNLLPLPEQATVVDVKAAENATLGTKYEATGPPQSISRSSVRMERINGLTDDKDWKGEPVFEQKLYYRAERVISGNRNDDEDDDNDDMSEDEATEVIKPPLDVYKAEKIEQITQYHSELGTCMAEHLEEAEERLHNVKNKINLSESVEDVDENVKLFYDDLTRRQIVGH